MKKTTLISVVFPIVVMAAWLGKLNWVRSYGTEVQLAVEGYDPRDLLAGHYLTYRVNYGSNPCPDFKHSSQGAQCVCLSLSAQTGNHEANWVGPCQDREASSCPLFIEGNCRYGRFEANIERIYFPERFTKELRVVPQKSVIKVKLNGSGQGQVTQLLVDGVDMMEYARKNQASN